MILGVVVMLGLAVDMIAHRGEHGRGRGKAACWSLAWIALALAFGGWVALTFGSDAGQDFVTAYLLEKSLSIDNLFIFLVVFSRLKIPENEQHRVLHWGILGALVTRGVFIAGGATLLDAWHGVVYVLGAFLAYTGVKTLRSSGGGTEGKIMAFVRRQLPITSTRRGHHFFAVENGRHMVTPLFLALIVVEITDVVFAVDSIPAVFAVSRDPFIVYSSNVFAVLGLRALYLVVASLLKTLRYLHYGLGAILILAGAKMLTSGIVEIPHYVSLVAVLCILIATVLPSFIHRRAARSDAPSTS